MSPCTPLRYRGPQAALTLAGLCLPALALAASPEAPTPSTSPTEVAPPRTPRHALELEALIAPTVYFDEPAHPELQDSFSRLGMSAGLTLGYRPHYFVTPFLGLTYAELARGQATLGTGESIGQRLGAWTMSGGLHLDHRRWRLRAGIGFTVAEQDNMSGGESHRTSQFALSGDFGLSYSFVQLPRFASALEVRFIESPGVDVQYLSLGFSVRADFWTSK